MFSTKPICPSSSLDMSVCGDTFVFQTCEQLIKRIITMYAFTSNEFCFVVWFTNINARLSLFLFIWRSCRKLASALDLKHKLRVRGRVCNVCGSQLWILALKLYSLAFQFIFNGCRDHKRNIFHTPIYNYKNAPYSQKHRNNVFLCMANSCQKNNVFNSLDSSEP